ncbi:MAG: nitroreductase family protein [Candidatus Aminicenantales bacterium]
MELPVASWYEAVFQRHSRRTFTSRPPEEEKLARLDRVCREFRPFPEARSVLVHDSPETVFKGLLGNYGRVKGAVLYIAFIGWMDSPWVQEAAGYTGEGIILEATSLGLATCWVGGFFSPEAVRKQIEIQDGEKVLSVTPVGHSPEWKEKREEFMSAVVGSRRRRALSGLIDLDTIPPRLEKAFAAARLAPSAQNRQPWRFRIEQNAVIISTGRAPTMSSISKRLDCGIAMLHFELGARAAGVAGRWELLPSPDVARFIF